MSSYVFMLHEFNSREAMSGSHSNHDYRLRGVWGDGEKHGCRLAPSSEVRSFQLYDSTINLHFSILLMSFEALYRDL